MTRPWSVNRQAAKAVVLHARDTDDARLLLDMLGLVDEDGHQLLADDTRVVRVWDPKVPAPAANTPQARKAVTDPPPRGIASPPGLAVLPPPSSPTATPRRLRAVPDPAPPEEPAVSRPRPACGTRGGYQAHRHRGEEACAPCKTAAAEAQREKYARKHQKTPTEKAPPPAAPAAVETAPGPHAGPVMGKREPDASPQVSPSRSHTEEGGGLGASDAPAEPTAAPLLVGEPEWMVGVVRSHPEPSARRAAADALTAWAAYRIACDELAGQVSAS